MEGQTVTGVLPCIPFLRHVSVYKGKLAVLRLYFIRSLFSGDSCSGFLGYDSVGFRLALYYYSCC